MALEASTVSEKVVKVSTYLPPSTAPVKRAFGRENARQPCTVPDLCVIFTRTFLRQDSFNFRAPETTRAVRFS
jgi:hypothetical protein